MRIHWTDSDGAAALTRAAVLVLIAALAVRVTGVPPVDLHGPLHHLGIMDPLCGGTRAMFLLTSGHPVEAARYNPVVFPLAAVTLAQVARAVVGWTTGRWLAVQLRPALRRALITAAVVAVVALEFRQQLYADLLTRPWP